MEDIKSFFDETSKIGSQVIDLTIAWAKKNGHNPNLILKIVGNGLIAFSKIGNFEEYKPRYSGLLRSFDNENLASCIYDFINAKDQGFTKDEILYVLNEQLDIEKEPKQ